MPLLKIIPLSFVVVSAFYLNGVSSVVVVPHVRAPVPVRAPH